MRKQLQELLENRVQQCVSDSRLSKKLCPKIEKKKECYSKRDAEIVKAKAVGNVNRTSLENEFTKVSYQVHFQYLIKQNGRLVLEEEIEKRRAVFYKDVLVEEEEINQYFLEAPRNGLFEPSTDEAEDEERLSYDYNRLKAVQYAERWWNDYNPAYKKFEVDCTNFISQCMRAGGAPMRGMPNRSKGWWMGKTWSYSWSVANSLRWYLTSSKVGLRAKEVKSPGELLLGDVICYDFEGDGRYNHNTIVTAKDAYGMPLVNAHTTNSRMRYWAYEDSTAYTPNIKYKFFSIVDDR
jgi:hypothetical protein